MIERAEGGARGGEHPTPAVKREATLFGLYAKTWKEMFLCQQTKPKLMDHRKRRIKLHSTVSSNIQRA
jgi:hypothetical protein